MTIDNYNIPIWMISISDNPVSQYWKSEVIDSWTSRGYAVNHFEAITPKSVNQFDQELTFTSNQNRRPFTDTEKAVFCSHYCLWKKALENPLIVVEHDILLQCDLPSVFSNELVDGFATTYVPRLKEYRMLPAGAYYITPSGASELISAVTSKPITSNVDAYLYRLGLSINRKCPDTYGANLIAEQMFDPLIGTTIQHGKK